MFFTLFPLKTRSLTGALFKISFQVKFPSPLWMSRNSPPLITNSSNKFSFLAWIIRHHPSVIARILSCRGSKLRWKDCRNKIKGERKKETAKRDCRWQFDDSVDFFLFPSQKARSTITNPTAYQTVAYRNHRGCFVLIKSAVHAT